MSSVDCIVHILTTHLPEAHVVISEGGVTATLPNDDWLLVQPRGRSAVWVRLQIEGQERVMGPDELGRLADDRPELQPLATAAAAAWSHARDSGQTPTLH